MARDLGADATFRIPLRLGRRRRLSIVVNGLGVLVTVGMVGWAVVSALSGSRGGLLTGLGLLVTAALAAYL